MKIMKALTIIALLAPTTAMANNCPWDQFWDSQRQACVTFQDFTANTVEDYGSNTWVQPYTDAAAQQIRSNTSGTHGVTQR